MQSEGTTDSLIAARDNRDLTFQTFDHGTGGDCLCWHLNTPPFVLDNISDALLKHVESQNARRTPIAKVGPYLLGPTLQREISCDL